MKAGDWKLRGINRRLQERTCLLCMGSDAQYILLGFPERKSEECNLRINCGYVYIRN
jgi:hypothetical protein